jgi:hypothetical protein
MVVFLGGNDSHLKAHGGQRWGTGCGSLTGEDVLLHGASLRRALIPDCKAVQRLDELGTCQQGIHLERDEIGAE